MPAVFSLPEDGKKTPKYNGACIYLIVCPDATPYVGQAQKFQKRMWAHKSDGKLAWIHHAKYQAGKCKNKVCAISFAINKYGWENMEIIILQKYFVWDQQLLDSHEQYFIRFYNSFKNGYNSNEGGNRCKAHPPTEKTKAKISASNMGIGAKPVTSCKIKKEYADGTQLVEFVSYASATEAQRQTGVYQGDISKCCLKKRNSVGGRYWHFTEEDELVGEHRVPRIGRMLYSYKRALFSESPEGVKLLHESTLAAKSTLLKLTGIKFNPGNISNCCNGDRTTHHKYKFYFATPEMIVEFRKIIKKRKRE